MEHLRNQREIGSIKYYNKEELRRILIDESDSENEFSDNASESSESDEEGEYLDDVSE